MWLADESFATAQMLAQWILLLLYTHSFLLGLPKWTH